MASGLWLAVLRHLRTAAGAHASTSAPAGSGRQDLGLLLLELPVGDNSPVAKVG